MSESEFRLLNLLVSLGLNELDKKYVKFQQYRIDGKAVIPKEARAEAAKILNEISEKFELPFKVEEEKGE